MAIGLVLILSVADYWIFPATVSPAGPPVDLSRNALWLRYTWYFGEREADLPSLAARVQSFGISDGYFHVRSILADGSLKFHDLHSARSLNRELKSKVPGLRRIAWIYAGNRQGLGEVRLNDRSVRRKMISEALWLVRDCGFDGIQWDYEICPDGDEDLLALLDESRAALPNGTFLGAAVPTWFPIPFGGFGWSESYFGEVAQRCDQLAVMAYDTGAYSPRAYVWLVGQQVVRITQAIAAVNPTCRVIVGLPTYGDGTWSHNPRAENLRLGLVGVRNGLRSGANLSAWQGVGLFADYTTDGAEWREFDRSWRETK